ncbi:thiocillin/thiostrepton family thiazolyl peptide [Streptomyces sp. HMX112]
MEQNIDLNVLEISDLISGAGENDDLAQVMAASCTTSSVSTSSSSSSS